MTEKLDSAEKLSAPVDPVAMPAASVETHGHGEVIVVMHIMGVESHGPQEFVMRREATLLDVMSDAARLSGIALLPPGERPFDRLHQGDERGMAIEDLDESLGEFSRESVGATHFTLELMRTFRVNKRWDVALRPELSPREIMALPLIHLDFQDYTLFPPDSNK